MSWNDGYERKKFEQEQKAQAKVYRKCGMSEEQIQAMYLLDLREYRNNRNYATHIQSIEELESDGEESRNVLHRKFLLSTTCTMDLSECGRFGWIDEIENAALYIAISKLTAEQKELYTALLNFGASVQKVLGYDDDTVDQLGGWVDAYYGVQIDSCLGDNVFDIKWIIINFVMKICFDT